MDGTQRVSTTFKPTFNIELFMHTPHIIPILYDSIALSYDIQIDKIQIDKAEGKS